MSAPETPIEELASRRFSFVIIGGGTAGMVLASRLTEDVDVSVLVLEAGENRQDDPKINTPAMHVQLYGDPTYDWCFQSVRQAALDDRIVAQPRGRVLGGSSAINFMMASHPSAVDIDAWGRLGNIGWDWATLMPYYQRSETLQLDNTHAASSAGSLFDRSLYGAAGPIQLSLLPESDDEKTAGVAWRNAMASLGLDAKDDPRRGSTTGAYAVARFVDSANGWVRSYAAKAYYEPVRDERKDGLVIRTRAHVTRILLDDQELMSPSGDKTKTASAVEFEFEGKRYTVKAEKEIILSAGTFQSPQILELSGIGHPDILEGAGIKPLVENPYVGENLQDHPLVPLVYEVVDGVATAESLRQPDILQWAVAEFQAGRGGPLASGVTETSFLTHRSIIDDASPASAVLDRITLPPSGLRDTRLEIQREFLSADTEADVQISFGAVGIDPYQGNDLSRAFAHTDPGNYICMGGVLNHPLSRGSVHISSCNPTAPPVIDPNYLAHPVDLEMMADVVLFMQQIAETKPLTDLIKDRPNGLEDDKKPGKKLMPSFHIEQRLDRNSAMKLVKSSTVSSWHPIGTCAMLPKREGGVVDHCLRLYGVKNLRVVDASIMPLHIRGNICSSVYAIAERAADLIKKDWAGQNMASV